MNKWRHYSVTGVFQDFVQLHWSKVICSSSRWPHTELQVRRFILHRGAVKLRGCFCSRTSQSELESEARDQWKEKLEKSSQNCWQTGLNAICGAQTRCISLANETLHPSTDPRDTTRCKSIGNDLDQCTKIWNKQMPFFSGLAIKRTAVSRMFQPAHILSFYKYHRADYLQLDTSCHIRAFNVIIVCLREG